VRPNSEEVEADVSAQRAQFVAEYSLLGTHLRVLPAERSLRDLWVAGVLGFDPARSVLALDFDQTLTLVRPTGAGGTREKRLRGGTEALEALREMAAAGVRLCIVTAQSPSIATVQNAARECAELGIADLFGVQPADVASLAAALEEGKAVGTGGRLQATKRLLLLLLLATGRPAVDLVRIGLSPTRRATDGSLGYRLRSLHSGLWGAEQRLAPDDARPALCPVRAWEAYVEATRPMRRTATAAEPAAADGACEPEDDRLFLSLHGEMVAGKASAAARPMAAEEAVELASAGASAAGLSARDVRWLIEPTATEVVVQGGVKLAMMGNVIAARYNKPEGLNAWLAREALTPTRLAFVDDNSDNAFSMFMHFATREKEHVTKYSDTAPQMECEASVAALLASSMLPAPPPVCCAVWYPPEATGQEENYDAPTREMLLALSRGPI
jgi:hypothetical protein